ASRNVLLPCPGIPVTRVHSRGRTVKYSSTDRQPVEIPRCNPRLRRESNSSPQSVSRTSSCCGVPDLKNCFWLSAVSFIKPPIQGQLDNGQFLCNFRCHLLDF